MNGFVFQDRNETEQLEYIAENIVGLRSSMVVTVEVNRRLARQVMAVWETVGECGVTYCSIERWNAILRKVLGVASEWRLSGQTTRQPSSISPIKHLTNADTSPLTGSLEFRGGGGWIAATNQTGGPGYPFAEQIIRSLNQAAIVAVTDSHGTIIYVNDQFCAISQYSREELLGQNHRMLNSGHHPPGFFRQMYQTITRGDVWHGEMCNRAKDGSLYWVKATIVPFLGKNGKPDQYVAIREDITALKLGKIRIERLSKIYRALSEVNKAIVRMENESSLFPLVCRMTADFGDMALAWIGRPDETGKWLQPVSCYGNRQNYLEGIVISLNEDLPESRGPASTAFRNDQTVIVNHFDTGTLIPPWQERANRFGFKSCASFPIWRNAKSFAVLSVYHQDVDAFDREIIDVLEEITRDISFALDNFDRKRELETSHEQAIHANEQLQILIEAIPDAIFLKDGEGRWQITNEPAKQLFQLHAIPWQGKTEMELAELHPEYRTVHENCLVDDEKSWRHGRLTLSEETIYGHGNDRIFDIRKVPLFTAENQRKGLVIIGRDVTAFKQATELVNKLAHYDALTELPNRRLMLGHLDQAIARSSIHGYTGAVLFIDLDHFKILNDTAGHEIGDLLLKEVAARLKTCIHEEDMVARLGGDEFVIICQNLGHQKIDATTNAMTLGNHIVERFNVPFQLNQHSYHSSPSVGIALFSGHEFTVKELLKHADMAMYRAKAEGRNTVCFFDPHMQATLEGHNQIEEALHQVISGKQLHLHFQIQVNGTRHATGAEALLRWNSPEMGWVPPRQFIPVAEESELIVIIGEWVLKTACAQIKSWETDDLTRSLKLAVNVSSRQFHQPLFVQQVEKIVKNNGIDPTRLKLELTESTVLINIEDTIKKMRAIKSLGVGLSLDDFGTGYSSLLYLKELPLDQLKIDQTFVQDILIDKSDAILSKTIIDLAKNFGLNVIAEGVETEEQWAWLNQHGCHAHQGYLFGKPLPLENFVQLLQKIGQPNVAANG